MRNLKKILALVLALVMSLSLMATASAGSFQDVTDDNPYKTAIDVLDQLKVFQGFEDGTFKPTETLTRAQAAVLVYRIATGDVDNKYLDNYTYMQQSKFTDLDGYNWAKGYINYCQNAGIVIGTTATTFAPGDKVTGYQLLVMLLRTLGYGKAGEFTDPKGWELQTAAIAEREGILKNVTTGDLGAPAPRQMVAEILFRGLLTETVTYSALTSGGYTKGETLGKRELGLEDISGVVMANEYADLESDSVLAANKTRLDVDGKVYNLDVKSELTDIGELRHAYVHNGTTVLTGLTDEGGNTVKDSKDLERKGQGITVANLRGNVRINDDTQYFTNFGTESGNHNSEWRLEWNVTFTTTAGEATFTREYANVRQLCANGAFPSARMRYFDATGAAATPATAVSFTRVIFAGEQITDADLDIMRGIFASADSLGSATTLGINGYVFGGTNSTSDVNRNKDLSDDMIWRDFYDKYIRAGEEKITGSVNGDWLKIVDNDDDGVAEYVFLTNFWMTTVTGWNSKTNTWELENSELIDIDEVTLNAIDGELAVGDLVLYTYIDGVWHVNKPAPVKMTVAANGITNKTGVKDDVLKGTDGKDYDWSEIAYAADTYYDEVDYATVGISYNLYQDHFGFTRLFTESDGGFVLLTDGFYDTDNRHEVTYKAEIWNGDYVDVTVNNPTSARASVFINNRVDGGINATDREKNTWGRLNSFDQVYYTDLATRTNLPDGYGYKTNVAAYIVDGDGTYTLGRVQERNDKLVYQAYAIDMTNFTAATVKDQILYGFDATAPAAHTVNTARRIQATTQTQYYVVTDAGTADEKIVSWTGYNNPADYTGEIKRAYAVASREGYVTTTENASYRVADVIVFEAESKDTQANILAVALGNRQFGQRQQAITGLTSKGEEVVDLLTNVDATKSRTPDVYPDEVDDLLEVYTYDVKTGKILGTPRDASGKPSSYEGNNIYAGNVVAVERIRGVDYVTLSKHSDFNPANANAAIPEIKDFNTFDRSASNLVTVVRNDVKDYTVVYDQAADIVGDTAKTYRLADNNGSFDYGDMVIFMTDKTGAAYVINVSNSTWVNPTTGAVEVVPRLHWNAAGTVRGLYQRIWFEYRANHTNGTDKPVISLTGNNADKTVIADATTLATGDNGEYIIPYYIHQGKDVAAKVTIDPALKATFTVAGLGTGNDTLTYKKTGEQAVVVTVTGNPMSGAGQTPAKDEYKFVFVFDAPKTYTTLATVPGVVVVDNTATPKTIDATGYNSTIQNFVDDVEKSKENDALLNKTKNNAKIQWAFSDSHGEIPASRWGTTNMNVGETINIAALVVAEDGKTTDLYVSKTVTGAKIIVVDKDSMDNVELNGQYVKIVPLKSGEYVIEVTVTGGGDAYVVIDGVATKMTKGKYETKSASEVWHYVLKVDDVKSDVIVVKVEKATSIKEQQAAAIKAVNDEAAKQLAVLKAVDTQTDAVKKAITDIEAAQAAAKTAIEAAETKAAIDAAQKTALDAIAKAVKDSGVTPPKDTYAVTLTPGEGTEAKITGAADLTKVEKDTELTVTASLKEGYEKLVVKVDGKEVTLTDGAYKFTVTAATKVETSATKKTAVETSEKIQAKVEISGAALQATIYGYMENGAFALTAEQIAGALSQETNPFTGEKLSVSAADVNLEKMEVVAGDETITLLNKVVTPAQALWKVTYPGGVAYLKDSVENQKVTGVTAGVTKLIAKSSVVAAADDVCSVDDKNVGTIKVGPTEDVEYVSALPLNITTDASKGDIQKDVSGTAKGIVNVVYGTTPTALKGATAASHYIAVNGKLTFKTPESTNKLPADGDQVIITVNGVDQKPIIVAEDGSLTDTDIVITGVDSATKKVVITARVEKVQIPVTYNGSNVFTYLDDDDGEWKCTIKLPEGVTKLAYKDSEGELVSVDTAYASGVYTVSKDHAVDGKIELVPAYEVKGVTVGGSPTVRLYKDYKNDDVDAETVILASTTVLFPADGTAKIYAKAEAGKTVVGLKSTCKSEISAIKATPTVDGATKGIWEITVKSDVDATNDTGDFEVVANLAADNTDIKAELNAAIEADTKTGEITLAGITLKGKWKIDGNVILNMADNSLTATVAKEDVKVAEDGAVTVKITVTGGGIEQPGESEEAAEVGNFIVKMTDGVTTWRVVVPCTITPAEGG